MQKWRRLFVIGWVLAIGVPALAQTVRSPFDVLAPTPMQIAPGQTQETHILIRVPEKHYLYQDKTAVDFQSLEGLRIRTIKYPPAKIKPDPFFNKDVAVFEQDVDIAITLEAPADLSPGPRDLSAVVAFQGCSDKLCFRLEQKPVAWNVVVGTGTPQTQTNNTTGNEARSTKHDAPWREILRLPDFRAILAHGVGIAFLITFIGGMLTAFTPCVLPLLPVILLIIGIHPGAHRRNFFLALCLTFGLALTYAVIGLIGALAGVPMSFLFQQRWFLAVVILFYIAMALSMFGLFALQLPQAWQQRLQRVGGSGPKGAFLAGISTGLLATPCAGPVIGALVAYVGTQRDVAFGFSLLLTYGLGFGLIFLIVGTFYGTLTQRIKGAAAARVVKILLGLLLLIPAGYYGWVLFGGASQWQENEDAAFAQAKAMHRPVMIEFTAKSCPPCLILEKTTLRDPAVTKALTDVIVPLRIDTTFNTDAVQRLIDRYNVVGWPTILFVSPEGEIFHDLTMVGIIPTAEQLLQTITTAQQRVGGGR